MSNVFGFFIGPISPIFINMQVIHIINGPNLNLLGRREKHIYGEVSFEAFLEQLRNKYSSIHFDYYQSNHEGDLIDRLQEVGFYTEDHNAVGVILNAAGYTHTSIALGDTVTTIELPVVEVHISDINNREDFRKHSYVTEHAVHFITGKGLKGYELAVDFLLDHSGDFIKQ